MKSGSNKIQQKKKLTRSKNLSLYTSFSRFYVQDFISVAKIFKRSYKLSLFLLIIKSMLQLIVMLNKSVSQKIRDAEEYFDILNRYNILNFLNDDPQLRQALTISFLILNSLILVYIFIKYIKNTIETTEKQKKLKLLNFIDEKEKARSELSKRFDEILFSIVFQTYIYLFMIPSLLVSSIDLDNISSINICITLLVVIIISNTEYDYMISSQDALRQKYIDFQTVFSFFEAIAYFLVALLKSTSSMILLWIFILCELIRLIWKQPLFDRQIQNIAIFLNLYLFLIIIMCFGFVNVQTENSHLLFISCLLFIPLSFKASLKIEKYLITYNYKKFQENLNDNEQIGADILNFMVRKIFLKKEATEKQYSHFEIQNISFLIKNNEILTMLQKKEMEMILLQQKQSVQQNVDDVFGATDETLLNGYEVDERQFDGKEYIVKEQVFGDNFFLRRAISFMFNDLFIKERNKKQVSMIDIYYLVFIVEVLQNYQLFELTIVQMQKNVSLKHLQILNSIMQEVELRKNTMLLENNDQQIFSTNYYEAIVYDELILQTEGILQEAIQKKVGLLLFMKQRFINLEEIQGYLEELLKLRQDLIDSITLMIKVNEFSHRLYDVYLNYLETLSFSESDIRIERFNRYQNNQRQIFFELNSSDACIVFASLNNERDIKIQKVSNNLNSFLGYEKENIIGSSIEILMPLPYADIHKTFIMNFFERADTFSYLRNQLLFGLTQSNHIIPVSVDVKVNMISSEKEFGLTAYFQRNQKQVQFILFDASSSRLVSMTQEISQFIFPFIKNFNRVNMIPYFPFISHFRNLFANNSSNILSRTSQMTMNSVKTRNLVSNMSIRSYQNDGKSAKQTNQKQGENKQKKNFKEQNKTQNRIDQKEPVKSFHDKDVQSKNQKLPLKDLNSGNQALIEMYDESDERRYRNIQYLLIISNTQFSNLATMKSRSVQGISEYSFFLMNLSVNTSPSQGLEHIKYIEISQIKQISPFYNSKLILQIYNDEVEGFLTNLHNLRSADIQCIISELELRGNKESNKSQVQQNFNMTYDNQDSNILLLNSKHDNEDILYNRYMTKDQTKNDQLLDSQLINKQAIDIEDLNQYQYDDQTLEKNNKFTPINKQKSFQNEEKRPSLDQSASFLIKKPTDDVSTSYQGVNIKKNIKDLNDSSFNFMSPVIQNNQNNEQHANFSNYDPTNMQNVDTFIQKNFPFTPVSPAQYTTQFTSQSQQHAIFKFTSEQTTTFDQNMKRASGVNEQIMPKVDIFSPKDLTSQNFLVKSGMVLSPQNMVGNNLFSIQSQQDREMPIANMLSPNSLIPIANDGIHKSQGKSFHHQRQHTQSVHSLSKKRKQIQAKHRTEIKNLKDALDSSSNHSRESTSSSTRSTTKNIILQKFTLNVMKIVNLIGIVSFLIIVIVILQQYLSMSFQFDQYAKDLDFIGWAPKYQITLFQTRKNYLVNLLATSKQLSISKDPVALQAFSAMLLTDMLNSAIDVRNLLIKLQQQTTERQLMNRMLETTYIFKMVSTVDRNRPLEGQPPNYNYNLVDMPISLYVGSFRVYSYLFRYVRGLGLGLAQFIIVNNANQIVTALLSTAADCQKYSINQLSGIENDVNNVLIIICLVSAFCIFIIIPVYGFIQTKREQIIQLFGTFNSQFIDQTILEIQKMYSRNNNIKSISFQNINQENQKRQNLSSTSRLSRTNKKIVILAFLIFCLTLPYPILNKVLSYRYIVQNKESLPMLQILYTIQSFTAEALVQNFFAMSYKQNPDSPYTLAKNLNSINANILKINSIQLDLQDRLKDFMTVSMQMKFIFYIYFEIYFLKTRFDQDLFDNFFLKVFEDDICEISNKYPTQFQVQNATFTPTNCPTVYNGIMKKGLSIALKTYLQIFRDFYYITLETDIKTYLDEFESFQNTYEIRELLLYQDYLMDTLESLSQYLMKESNDHKAYLEKILFGLLLYQLLMMCLIFYFGWIHFYQSMDEYLHKTKLYLALLNINYLVSNPYIQNYLHKSLT